jgi:hypothetical protein
MSQLKLTKLHKVTLNDDSERFGYEITCYEDVTEITYFEYENDSVDILQRVDKESIRLTTGYDLQVFEEALRLRREELKEHE